MRLPLLLSLLLGPAAPIVFTVVVIIVLVVSIDITSIVVLLTCISSTIYIRNFFIDFDIVINTSTLQGRKICCGSNCIHCKGAVIGDIDGAATAADVPFT